MTTKEIQAKITSPLLKKIIESLGGCIVHEDSKQLIMNTICHHGNSTNKLYYYKDSKMFHCYTDCGDNFDIFELVCRNKNFEKHFEAKNYICNILGISATLKTGFSDDTIEIIDDWKFIRNQNKYRKQKIKNKELTYYNSKILNIFQKIYTSEWINDGISINVMKYFNILYSTLQQRIIIPHYDIDNKLIGVRGRTLLEEDEEIYGKYAPFQFAKETYSHPLSLNLYGLHKNINCIKKRRKVMLVESEKGVLQCATMFGIDDNFTLGLCGNKLSKEQLDLLISLGINEVIIALDKQFIIADDSDVDYVKWIKHMKTKFINVLVPYFNVYVIWDTNNLLNYKDSPTDKGKETLLQLMKNKIYITN